MKPWMEEQRLNRGLSGLAAARKHPAECQGRPALQTGAAPVQAENRDFSNLEKPKESSTRRMQAL
jgi:hypothetical protein